MLLLPPLVPLCRHCCRSAATAVAAAAPAGLVVSLDCHKGLGHGAAFLPPQHGSTAPLWAAAAGLPLLLLLLLLG